MGNKCTPIKFDQRPGTKPIVVPIIDNKKLKKQFMRWNSLERRLGSNAITRLRELDHQRFKRYLADGPPDNIRIDVWKVALEVKKIIGLDVSAHEDHTYIEKDLDRTFPYHSFFLRKKGKRALRDVLLTFVNNHPELGYCQGMNSVAGVFLIVSENATESYAMLKSLCYGFGAKLLYEYEFPLISVLCQEFHSVLAEKMPDLDQFLKEIELDDHLWLTKWFMTLFSYSFHIQCVVRMWDAVFAYGLGYMVNIALGVLEYLKPFFIGKSLQDMLEFFPGLREIVVDIDLVLYYSSRFVVRQMAGELQCRSYSLSQEADDRDPIKTNWEATPNTTQNSKNVLEGFSECFSNNSSKFFV